MIYICLIRKKLTHWYDYILHVFFKKHLIISKLFIELEVHMIVTIYCRYRFCFLKQLENNYEYINENHMKESINILFLILIKNYINH